MEEREGRGDEGNRVKDVVQRLQANDVSLTKLDKLDYDSNFEPKSWLQLFEALSKNSTLTKLDLSGFSGLDNESVRTLAWALRANSTLSELSELNIRLRKLAIADEGASALSAALACNRGLSLLDLHHNCIGDPGRIEIGNALRNRPHAAVEGLMRCCVPFTLRGLHLGRVASQLSLPPDAHRWSNKIIISFWAAQVERRIAFSMCAHTRLGQFSRWAAVEHGLLRLVLAYPIHSAEDVFGTSLDKTFNMENAFDPSMRMQGEGRVGRLYEDFTSPPDSQYTLLSSLQASEVGVSAEEEEEEADEGAHLDAYAAAGGVFL